MWLGLWPRGPLLSWARPMAAWPSPLLAQARPMAARPSPLLSWAWPMAARPSPPLARSTSPATSPFPCQAPGSQGGCYSLRPPEGHGQRAQRRVPGLSRGCQGSPLLSGATATPTAQTPAGTGRVGPAGRVSSGVLPSYPLGGSSQRMLTERSNTHAVHNQHVI